MHDPLTVLAAIDGCCDHGGVEEDKNATITKVRTPAYLPSAVARVQLDPSGAAESIAITAESIAQRRTATRGASAGCDWFWGHAPPKAANGADGADGAAASGESGDPPLAAAAAASDPPAADAPFHNFALLSRNGGDDGSANCTFTLGVLTPGEVAAFAERLRDVLVPDEAGGEPLVDPAVLTKLPLRRSKGLNKDLWSKSVKSES